MKKNSFLFFAFLLAGLFFSSCEKEKTSALIQDVIYQQTGNGAATILATILDDNDALKSAKLYYKDLAAATFKSVDMTGTVNGIFSATIDSFPLGTEIGFYIEVVNGVDLTTVFPEGAPGTLGTFTSGVVTTSPLKVNEVFANGTKAPDTSNPDWAEIYNSGTTEIDLTGYSIQDNLEKPTARRFIKAGLKVPAKGFIVIHCEVNNDQAVDGTGSFGLSTSGSDGVTLFNANGQIVDKLYYPEPSAGQPTADPNKSWGRFADGTATAGWMIPSKGLANTAATPN